MRSLRSAILEAGDRADSPALTRFLLAGVQRLGLASEPLPSNHGHYTDTDALTTGAGPPEEAAASGVGGASACGKSGVDTYSKAA